MPWPESLSERLKTIAEASSLEFADIAAGDESGLLLRLKHSNVPSTGPPSTDVSWSCELSDRRYLVASITKPVISMLAVQLAADGAFSLNAYVRDFLDSFCRGPLRTITVRHLLTHTSGLPDMLQNNNELRSQHATLEDFVHHTTRVTPEFAAGTDCRYSSMGFAVLAVIIEQFAGKPLPQFVADRLFEPLGMSSSWLGLPAGTTDDLMPTILPCKLPIWQQDASGWSWNSRYWRTLGAAWGGMISTAEDLGRLAVMILRNGRSSTGETILSSSTISSSTQNQTRHMGLLPATDRNQRPWGLGWRLNWLDHSSCFSDFLPQSAIGHWGATGTLMWIDRRSNRWCVILTTQPYEESQAVIQRLSNLVASSPQW